MSLDHEQGAEIFYNVEVLPWLHVTPDLQVVDPSRKTFGTLFKTGSEISSGVVAAVRVKVDF